MVQITKKQIINEKNSKNDAAHNQFNEKKSEIVSYCSSNLKKIKSVTYVTLK